MRGDDGVGSEEAHRLIAKVHGATAALAAACGPGKQFGHDMLRVAALGKSRAVPAIGGEHQIVRSKRGRRRP